MANIGVREFSYKSVVDKETITVSVSADGKLIKELDFSTVAYTTTTAEESVRFTAENFGILGPGNEDLYVKSAAGAPLAGAPSGPVYVYDVEEFGPMLTVIVYKDGAEIFKGNPSFSAGEAILVKEAIISLEPTHPGVDKMTRKSAAGGSAGASYKYEIKSQGPRHQIIVYQINNTGEKEIFKGDFASKSTVSAENLKQEAITGLSATYPGVQNMIPKTPSPPPAPPTEPPITPPPSPLPEKLKTTEPPKYLPQSKYKKAKKAVFGEFVVKDTQESYEGMYIETYRKQYFAGETPEQNGVELEKIEKSSGFPDVNKFLKLGLSLLAALQAAFKKQLSQDEINKGIAKRYFVQDNRDKKISETSEELFEQGKIDLPDFKYVEVPWHINSPADDVVINGAKFQGSESRNKQTIQNLEKELPGISKFVTDYRYLVAETPAPLTPEESRAQTQVVRDTDTLDANFRKARFDTRK
jgi:hypothetical protein